ncbi:uncharacterized protein FOMMEDRAFT_151576 [Fomitiporia mediterranea MF3/22]|uniref:uncharacterized protein n=1 Tax=Fomitiporia mediterranea (strain MF3/22) TaxID=694068 RepID=UPI0004408DEE|nr:uncharacterized protein FOMMEDRAFT_151576 [Fomitiporia mediterranea MF3/22]EJD06336.1 hypothetical protein FOMMEDRAFT_151576 [Fomitiporia mediterranea MF3/22]
MTLEMVTTIDRPEIWNCLVPQALKRGSRRVKFDRKRISYIMTKNSNIHCPYILRLTARETTWGEPNYSPPWCWIASKVLAPNDNIGIQQSNYVWVDHVDLSSVRMTRSLSSEVDLNTYIPSFRFGTGHIFNSVFENNDDGINTRNGTQLPVENNVWSGLTKAVRSTDNGSAVSVDNEFSGATGTVPTGTFTDPTIQLFIN